MKLFAFLLLLAAFLQTSFLSLNLCLLLLISRSYAVHKKDNYYLAFLAGIIIGILTTVNLGIWPLIFLVVVLLCHTIRRLPIMNRTITVVPLTLIILLVVNGLEFLFFKTPVNWLTLVIGSIINLPIFYLVKEWEERFITKPGLKLKYS